MLWYGLVALALGVCGLIDVYFGSPRGSPEVSATQNESRVYPYGKINGFFVYIVKGLPDDPDEPLLTLTLTPIGEPGCDIVWALVNDPRHPWSFVGPHGCKGKLKSFAYYEQKLLEALCMYRSGFEA